ncbi:Forkhead box protein O4 [Portunus trituberculatus]|uniref:Forkhead box protein O4 n=1 Tax=Portunus trituberculatus TaxID=210409 RepID=A0A5B7F1K4_PORTR|nr:Forkhead box protein O4 [Portunus trituberculatus]
MGLSLALVKLLVAQGRDSVLSNCGSEERVFLKYVLRRHGKTTTKPNGSYLVASSTVYGDSGHGQWRRSGGGRCVQLGVGVIVSQLVGGPRRLRTRAPVCDDNVEPPWAPSFNTMASGFFSLVKEEPDSGHEMETTPVALPPTSASMGGHTPPGSGGRHVACPPLQAAMPLTPISSRQPPLRRMEIDPNFEPVARSRSNTWPLPCPEGYVESEEPVAVPGEGPVVDQARPTGAMGGLGDPTGGPPKKNTSRRNPWGNMSYADLIAQAIMSSPETRATLSQIYDWMVQNVPYFKDKGDSNSSAGWKVGSSRRGRGRSHHMATVAAGVLHELYTVSACASTFLEYVA